MATGWNRLETNYSNNLHDLPSFPYTVDQASPLQSLEHSGHYMVAETPNINPSSCSPTDHYSDIFGVDQLDSVPPFFLVGLESNNDPNYFNNLHLQACSNVFPQGITADACTGYLEDDDHHHQKVADLPHLFDDQYNFLDPIDQLADLPHLFDDQYNFLDPIDLQQLINENWNSSDFEFDFTQNQNIGSSQTFLDGVAAPQSASDPSAISGTQSEYVLGMLVDGLTASQSSSEPSSSAGIKGPRSKKWPDEEMSKLLNAIEIFRERPRMWEDIRREFFNGSGRTTNSLKQKFKDMKIAANSMSDPKEIYLRARDLAASIRDEKNRKWNQNR